MASYIGKVQLNGANDALVGSTMYGICNTGAAEVAKTVTTTDYNDGGKFINTNFDSPMQGVTIYVKFINGNEASGAGLTLQVGSTLAKPIVGKFICQPNTIIGFTYNELEQWAVNTYQNVVTDIENNSSSLDVPTTRAVAAYVQSLTGGLSGLTGAMHFRGVSTTAITDGGTEHPTIDGTEFIGAVAGDVVLYNQQEYVWVGDKWELLGDEGSYVLKTSQKTDTIDEVTSWTDGTAPQLTVTDTEVSKMSASVSSGILNITVNPVTVGSASGWNAGTMPTLAQTSTTVVVPV